IPYLDNQPDLARYAELPRSQKSEGRITEEYIRELCFALKLPYDRFETGQQIHGINVITAENVERRHNPDCDGFVIAKRGGAAGVFLADCQPIILWHRRSATAAIIHAGWRGTVAGIARVGLERVCAVGSAKPDDLFAFLGPCISAANYGVGEDVVRAAVNNGLEEAVVTGDFGKSLFALTRANAAVLADNGLPEENMYSSDLCTYEMDEHFYSYRRAGEEAGRFLAAVHIE
ncbi:MAG: polyphenol oxidase family protein, partial [bacterium]|nr:polyphenol oxidase family protein [bacterium]